MFDAVLAPPRPSWHTRWFLEPQPALRARWIWTRALGAIFFSAFYSLAFQIHGLIGPHGILPARDYLRAVHDALGWKAYWFVPTLLWFSASDRMLTAIVAIGIVASIAIVLNLWPRASIVVAFVCFLSFVAAAQEFSGYQSDGMLLEAAFLSLFLVPRGLRPRLGAHDPPSRAAIFLLQWEWFRIYFESGLVKLLSGEVQWRNLTAMDKYYENGPLPTWIGWHVQQLPHAFHAATALLTLIVELVVVWLLFVPHSRARLIAFAITTPLQIGIILTANYAFLNYLVLSLGFLLLDDGVARSSLPVARRRPIAVVALPLAFTLTILIFLSPSSFPARLVEPFRIVNNYGLFAVMTRARYEIEFQGTRDGKTWIAYPFRSKPQDPREAPHIFAPYQPRFDWNLWFASLGTFENNLWVVNVQERLLQNEPSVLHLFRANPFRERPPVAVRAVIWQYWFTTRDERRRTGTWWRRELLGEYAPVAQR
ncbi:MAG TPA: lipase maturation factor family protein [Thermoanaerobaculia bacterium]|nr:lipase maturation factor family protein [Thermoanaerobaculia bacterium]